MTFTVVSPLSLSLPVAITISYALFSRPAFVYTIIRNPAKMGAAWLLKRRRSNTMSEDRVLSPIVFLRQRNFQRRRREEEIEDESPRNSLPPSRELPLPPVDFPSLHQGREFLYANQLSDYLGFLLLRRKARCAHGDDRILLSRLPRRCWCIDAENLLCEQSGVRFPPPIF